MFQRALICTDFEDGLYRLVNFVPSLAAAGLRAITFLHVLHLQDDREIPRPEPEKEQQARDRLSAALANVPEGIDVQIDVQTGRAADRVLNAIKVHQSDVVILGTPMRTRLDELFGSTTRQICKQVKIPVLILRPQLISAYTNEELELRCRHLFRYLLIPYDGSNSSNYLIEQVKLYAKDRPANSLERCFLSWVVDDVGRRGLQDVQEYQVQQAESKIASVTAELEMLNLKSESDVLRGSALAEILNVAIEKDISAIAISSESMGKLLEWSVPSFAGELMRQSMHPVLYFPTDE
ncbi:MAG: universal stress protein [Elainellaceae cyanobacterium]